MGRGVFRGPEPPFPALFFWIDMIPYTPLENTPPFMVVKKPGPFKVKVTCPLKFFFPSFSRSTQA